MRVDILLTDEKHWCYHINSRSGDVWAHDTGLTPPLLLGYNVPCHVYMCDIGVNIAFVSDFQIRSFRWIFFLGGRGFYVNF